MSDSTTTGRGLGDGAAATAPVRDYRNRVLVLQGGGALGSYQAGVFEQLVAAGIDLNWVAGISIGAINAALIAGNPPERRVERLHEFWEQVCRQPLQPPLPAAWLQLFDPGWLPTEARRWLSTLQSTRSIFEGQAGFFVPRRGLLPFLPGADPSGAASYYDTAPLARTLERLVDFDRINAPGAMRVSVGAVHVTTGDLVYFDSRERRLDVRHFMASAALPPAFPAVEIDGEHYWDGGILMNTPLIHVLQSEPRHDTLVFQVDLWSARGALPTSLPEVDERQKDIAYASRTRLVNDSMRDLQSYRKCIDELLALVPDDRRDEPAALRGRALACDRRCNVQQLICADAKFEGSAKDHEFGRSTMHRHWQSGMADLRRLLSDPARLAMPGAGEPFEVHFSPPEASPPEASPPEASPTEASPPEASAPQAEAEPAAGPRRAPFAHA